jgi:hypothetical protein
MQVMTMREQTRSKYFGVYTQKYFVGRAPDADESINFEIPRGKL